MKTFKEIGLENNNDKITYHRYDLIYPIFLEPLRERSMNVLEIGLGDGKSGTGKSYDLLKEYFPNSYLFIMDINHEFYGDGYEVIKGDQNNIEDLKNVYNRVGSAEIIIDDGSHHPRHQFNSFCFLFDKLLSNGGYYIIEDIECSYWSKDSEVYGYEIGYDNIFDFFKRQIDSVNSEFSGKNNPLKISFITFAKNCIIIKKQSDEEISLNKREYRFKHML